MAEYVVTMGEEVFGEPEVVSADVIRQRVEYLTVSSPSWITPDLESVTFTLTWNIEFRYAGDGEWNVTPLSPKSVYGYDIEFPSIEIKDTRYWAGQSLDDPFVLMALSTVMSHYDQRTGSGESHQGAPALDSQLNELRADYFQKELAQKRAALEVLEREMGR